jgi:triphosphoribosyl-dephospho-CoA synthase
MIAGASQAMLARPAPALPDPRQQRHFCSEAARIAVGCLHTELILYPKPGLVSLVDNGSHTDMTAVTFMRSMFALRHYFARICRAGIDDAPFATLKQLGIDAETRMLHATGGINTHRGAIFSLGMLSASIGRARAQGMALTGDGIRAIMLIRWGEELAGHTRADGAASHGLLVAETHAASGAREEGALGLPSVFEVGLPAMRRTLGAGRSMHHARIDALFALMAHVSDTNVYYRGGAEGASTVKRQATRFIGMGGTAHPEWRDYALECHRILVAQKLSPGGAADLLAATCLVHSVTSGSLS